MRGDMVWKPKRSGGLPWREYLTPEEARELAKIEREAERIDEGRRQLTAQRNLIVNRAIQRARHAELEKRRKSGIGV